MRTVRPRLLSLLAAAGMLTAAAVAPAAQAAPETPRLVGIRAAHHPGYDRVVFDFQGARPLVQHVGYVDQLRGDGSGDVIPTAGRAILELVLFGAEAHTATGDPTSPERVAFALPNVMVVQQSGDFEGYVSHGIGLAKRMPFRVFTLPSPSRVVVDIDAPATVNRSLYLVDVARVDAGTPPYVVAVTRPVLPTTPATGLMDRLFAGATDVEQSRGLSAITSHATGFSNLSVADGIARVRLTGGCSSGGSTVTIADEIRPTLRQFATVDHVKVYDPAGRTERPTGHSDSIPTCLEP